MELGTTVRNQRDDAAAAAFYGVRGQGLQFRRLPIKADGRYRQLKRCLKLPVPVLGRTPSDDLDPLLGLGRSDIRGILPVSARSLLVGILVGDAQGEQYRLAIDAAEGVVDISNAGQLAVLLVWAICLGKVTDARVRCFPALTTRSVIGSLRTIVSPDFHTRSTTANPCEFR